MLTGLVNRLFQHKTSRDYLYVYGLEGERVLGVVVDREGLPKGKHVVPSRVFVPLGTFAKEWTEVPRVMDWLDALTSALATDEGAPVVIVDLRRRGGGGACPVHGDKCGEPKAERLN